MSKAVSTSHRDESRRQSPACGRADLSATVRNMSRARRVLPSCDFLTLPSVELNYVSLIPARISQELVVDRDRSGTQPGAAAIRITIRAVSVRRLPERPARANAEYATRSHTRPPGKGRYSVSGSLSKRGYPGRTLRQRQVMRCVRIINAKGLDGE